MLWERRLFQIYYYSYKFNRRSEVTCRDELNCKTIERAYNAHQQYYAPYRWCIHYTHGREFDKRNCLKQIKLSKPLNNLLSRKWKRWFFNVLQHFDDNGTSSVWNGPSAIIIKLKKNKLSIVWAVGTWTVHDLINKSLPYQTWELSIRWRDAASWDKRIKLYVYTLLFSPAIQSICTKRRKNTVENAKTIKFDFISVGITFFCFPLNGGCSRLRCVCGRCSECRVCSVVDVPFHVLSCDRYRLLSFFPSVFDKRRFSFFFCLVFFVSIDVVFWSLKKKCNTLEDRESLISNSTKSYIKNWYQINGILRIFRLSIFLIFVPLTVYCCYHNFHIVNFFPFLLIKLYLSFIT